MTEPTTDAGRRLLVKLHWNYHAPMRGCVEPCGLKAAILAIEQEAREKLLDEGLVTLEHTKTLLADERADLAARIEARIAERVGVVAFTGHVHQFDTRGTGTVYLNDVIAIVREEASDDRRA